MFLTVYTHSFMYVVCWDLGGGGEEVYARQLTIQVSCKIYNILVSNSVSRLGGGGEGGEGGRRTWEQG